MPTGSFYRWENRVTELCVTHLQPHTEPAGSSGRAARTPTPAQDRHHPRGGSASPPGRPGCGKESPSAGTGGLWEGLSWGSAPDGHGCPHTHWHSPKDCARAGAATVPLCRELIPSWPGSRVPALTKFPAPCRLFRLLFSAGLQANGPGELQRSWKKANACLTRSRRVESLQERWAFPSATESTQSRPALASLDDLQLLLVL